MSDDIEYQGKHLGMLHPGRKDSEGKHKWVLTMANLNALEVLLKLSPSDELIVSGRPESYEKFRSEILEKADTIYTSFKAYVRSEFPFPLGLRIPEEIAKKAGLM